MERTGFVCVVVVLGLIAHECSAAMDMRNSSLPSAKCGRIGQPCCQGMVCGRQSTCSSKGTNKVCLPCGKNGQRCCDGQCSKGICTKEDDERCRPVQNLEDFSSPSRRALKQGDDDDDDSGGSSRVPFRAPTPASSCGKLKEKCCSGQRCNVGWCNEKGICDWQVTIFTQRMMFGPVPSQFPRRMNRIG